MSARGWILGGSAAVVAVGAGAATWAAVSFFDGGPRAAQALPADTLAYIALDLNPGGSQKIAALKLANKFPALRKELNIDSTGDLRKKVVETLSGASSCALDYGKDVQPWIGDTVAVGVVDAADPTPVMVLEVTDTVRAEAGADALAACAVPASKVGYEVRDGWLVMAPGQGRAAEVADAAERSSLAEDADFTKWTSLTGEDGILTGYVAPGALAPLGKVLQETAGEVAGLGGVAGLDGLDGLDGLGEPDGTTDSSTDPFGSLCPTGTVGQDPAVTTALDSFAGAGATLRFGGDGLELNLAGDAGASTGSVRTAGVRDLPADSGLVLAAGFSDGWWDSVAAQLSQSCGDLDLDSLYSMVGLFTGLDLPEDLEALTSSSVQAVVSSEISVETLVNSTDASELPIGLRITGDTARTSGPAGKIQSLLTGSDQDVATGKDAVAVGFAPDFRKRLARGGTLGDSSSFSHAVPHAEEAAAVLYADLKAFRPALTELLGGTTSVSKNLEPLRAVGLAGWVDADGVSRSQLILSVE